MERAQALLELPEGLLEQSLRLYLERALALMERAQAHLERPLALTPLLSQRLGR